MAHPGSHCLFRVFVVRALARCGYLASGLRQAEVQTRDTQACVMLDMPPDMRERKQE